MKCELRGESSLVLGWGITRAFLVPILAVEMAVPLKKFPSVPWRVPSSAPRNCRQVASCEGASYLTKSAL